VCLGCCFGESRYCSPQNPCFDGCSSDARAPGLLCGCEIKPLWNPPSCYLAHRHCMCC
jgi:hypothetical protein